MAEATLGPQRTDFLLRATKVLFSSLDHERTLRTLADLCVPEIADWCTVHTLGPEGAIEQVATAYADPAWAPLAREWVERFPARLDDPAGVGAVIRTGKASVAREITGAILRASTRSAEVAEYAERVGVRSAMILPLTVHGQTHGALVLTQTASGRRFGPEEELLAEELALRAAVAIENARLFQRERKARERVERLQQATAQLARARTPAQIAAALVDHAGHAGPLRGSAFALRTPDDNALRVVAATGVAASRLDHEVPLEANDALAEAVRERRAVHARAGSDAAAGSLGRDASGLSWSFFPLSHGDAVHGALALAFASGAAPPPEDVAYLEALVEQAGQALGRARLEEALLFQKTLLESQNEAALDGIFFQDENARAVFWNQRLLEMWGVSEDLPKKTRIEDRLAASMGLMRDPQAFVDVVMEMEKRRDATLRLDLHLKDGRIFDCYSAPVHGADGSYRGRVWFYRDVTQRRLVEDELVQARRQLAQSEKLAALGSLVSGVAHEVRTPLAYAANHAFLLQQAIARPGGPDAARLQESTTAIAEAVERIDRLVQDLRRFTRFEGAGECDADEAVTGAARLFEATHRGRVRLDLHASSGSRLLLDRLQLQQVVLNLLENAADASPPGGAVRVSASRDGADVLVEVRDEGPGIPEEVVARMWEPFFTTKPEGTGLGLSIVRRIAEAAGGSVACRSTLGKGTTFVVRVPAADAPAKR